MQQEIEIVVLNGESAGKRYKVPQSGLRLGRSSTNEVAVKDEELSRNHCMFEKSADGTVQIIDLASANGTFLNGEMLGSEPKQISAGDSITAGATKFKVVKAGDEVDIEKASQEATDSAVGGSGIDLGLDAGEKSGVAENGKMAAGGLDIKRASLVNMIWAGVVVVFALAIGIILCVPSGGGGQLKKNAKNLPPPKPKLYALSYEKIEADSTRIFRYAMTINEDGILRIVYDDVPGENRHVDKSAKLSEAAIDHVVEMFTNPKWEESEEAYTGASVESENSLKRWKIRTVMGRKAHEVLVENSVEPDYFKEIREALEVFSRNELGVWALQYSREELLRLAAESEKIGDTRLEEADVEYGNVAEAVKAYRDAVFYLDTVNPKPQSYPQLKAKQIKAKQELDTRYQDQSFIADKALNLGDWETAARELRILIDIINDTSDERSVVAKAKLNDVEDRMKKKGGKRK